MSIVKITNKQKLEELIAKLTLRLGKKPKQQDILDICVNIGYEHFDELIMNLTDTPTLDDEKIKKIKSMRKKLKNVKFLPIEKAKFAGSDDKEIYSI